MIFKKNKNDKYTRFEANPEYYDNATEEGYEFGYQDKESYDYYNESVNLYSEKIKINLLSKIFIFIALYILFLFMGFLSTSFVENKTTGIKEPQIINLMLKEERESYKLAREHYIANKELVLKIQEINKKLSNSVESDYFSITTEYSELLPIINSNISKARAMTIGSKYSNIKEQTVTVYDTAAIYIQKMNSALISNNQELMYEAFYWENKMHEIFITYEANMINFSKLVKFEDTIYERNPLFPVFKDALDKYLISKNSDVSFEKEIENNNEQ